jgi:hypothetical protein
MLVEFAIVKPNRAQQAQSAVPVFKFSPDGSIVNFNVSASVTIAGKFDKWDASLTFTSRELSSGVGHQNRCRQCRHGERHEG